MGKRAIDVVCAVVAIVLTLPVAMAVAGIIRISMGSPVVFRQRRSGLHGTPFVLVKFRTMVDRDDAAGSCLPDAARLTRVGRFLRASSLDEIPQLLNVLAGDMSLIGPRPLPVEYVTRYTQRQARRHDVRPGISGLAQVEGRNALSWEQKFELDLEYVERLSPELDLKIFAKTLWQVVACRGICQPGRATADPFLGTLDS